MAAQYSEWKAGWKPLAAAALGVACGATVIPFNTLGAVIAPLDSQYQWGRGNIQLGYFYFTIASALALPLAGMLADRYGGRRIAILSLPIFALCFAAIGLFGNSLWAFYFCWIGLGLFSAGATPVTFTRVVNSWFSSQRGLALAATLFAAGLSTSFYQAASSFLVERYGWQSVFWIFSLFPILIALPIAVLYLHEPKKSETERKSIKSAPVVHQKMSITQIWPITNYKFWALILSIVAVTLGISGTVMNLKPLLSDKGMSTASIALAMGLIGISVTLSRLGVGWLIDIFWAPAVAAPLFLLPVIAVVILMQGEITTIEACFAAILIGLAVGAEGDLIAYLCAKYFGMTHYGKIYGVVFGIFILVSGIAPFLFGYAYDVSGTYHDALLWAAGAFVFAGLAILGMGRYPPEKVSPVSLA